MTRVYVVDVRLWGGQMLAAYVEAESYPMARLLARERHPDWVWTS